MAEISCGVYLRSSISTRGVLLSPFTTLYGTRAASLVTSLNWLPIKRLIDDMVFVGFVIAWRFAGSPTLRSPLSINATTDGVVRLPSLLAIPTGSFPSITATQEFVVPKSIPIILDIYDCFFLYYLLLTSLVPTCSMAEIGPVAPKMRYK